MTIPLSPFTTATILAWQRRDTRRISTTALTFMEYGWTLIDTWMLQGVFPDSF